MAPIEKKEAPTEKILTSADKVTEGFYKRKSGATGE